jgi:hypothetical protein
MLCTKININKTTKIKRQNNKYKKQQQQDNQKNKKRQEKEYECKEKQTNYDDNKTSIFINKLQHRKYIYEFFTIPVFTVQGPPLNV